MTHEQQIDIIWRATSHVFATMVGTEVVMGEAHVSAHEPGTTDGVLGLIGLAGAMAGAGTFACSASTARKIAGQMLMQEFGAVDDEVLDVVGEITNMILGNVKTMLEEGVGPMGLSIPTVVYGRNFTTRSVGSGQWIIVPFDCLGEHAEVHLCLAPGKSKALPSRYPVMLVHGR